MEEFLSVKCRNYNVKSFMSSSGLWLHVHQRVWTESSSWTLHEGMLAFSFKNCAYWDQW